jgi:hypothetical protein
VLRANQVEYALDFGMNEGGDLNLASQHKPFIIA